MPGSEPDVTYAYDNLGRATSASQTGNSLAFTWDALGRRLTETGPQGTAASEYDLANRRTKLTYPGSGLYVNSDYLVTGEVTTIRENGATSGVGVLASNGYDNVGNRTSVTFGNGASQAFTPDDVSRLASLTNDLTGTTNDLSANFGYNPASQINANVRTGDTYAWTGHFNVNRAYTSNGLNQYSVAGPASLTYDTKGNLTSDGTSTFSYSSENLLTSALGATGLSYDPALRLYQIAGGATTRFAYDGVNMIAEYDGSNSLQRRFVFGPGIDQPIVQYEGSGTTDRRFMSADERASVISLSDSSGTLLNINRYDEYGTPQSGNTGRFQYTGQAWLGEVGMQYSKARMYSPTLGRFLQTDPIGYVDSPNLYAYVLNDPINLSDPLGLLCGGVVIGLDSVTISAPCKSAAVPWPGGRGNVRNPPERRERGIVIVGTKLPKIGHRGCPAPAISSAERAASRRGDRTAFWNLRAAAGDPLAGTALSIINNSNFSGEYANVRLRDYVSSRSPGMSSGEISAEVQQIGVDLMRAHIAAIDALGSPTPSDIADYHNDVLNSHGLPSSAFGGTMVFDSAGLTNLLTGWAGCRP